MNKNIKRTKIKPPGFDRAPFLHVHNIQKASSPLKSKKFDFVASQKQLYFFECDLAMSSPQPREACFSTYTPVFPQYTCAMQKTNTYLMDDQCNGTERETMHVLFNKAVTTRQFLLTYRSFLLETVAILRFNTTTKY